MNSHSYELLWHLSEVRQKAVCVRARARRDGDPCGRRVTACTLHPAFSAVCRQVDEGGHVKDTV